MKKPINVFIAYSRKDRELLEELKSHLIVLRKTKNLNIWYDGLIESGSEWEKEVLGQMYNSDVILLLISQYFISSDYCYEKEMKDAIKLHKEKKVKLIPIILRECLWEDTPFSELQVLPKDGKPVNSIGWETFERPYYLIAKELKQVISSIEEEKSINQERFFYKEHESPKITQNCIKSENDVEDVNEVKKIRKPISLLEHVENEFESYRYDSLNIMIGGGLKNRPLLYSNFRKIRNIEEGIVGYKVCIDSLGRLINVKYSHSNSIV